MSVLSTNPSLPKDVLNGKRLRVTLTGGKKGIDMETSRGAVETGLVVDFTVDGELVNGKLQNVDVEGIQEGTWSKMWGLDKKTIGGSAGRVLTVAKVKNVSEMTDSALTKLKGTKFTVRIDDNKQYWS